MSKTLPTIDDCQGCGVCCMHMGYPAFLTGNDQQPAEDAWTRLPDHLRSELQEVIENYQAPEPGQLDGPCVWLDLETRRCIHHTFRPRVCRDFSVGSRGCIEWREHYHDKIVFEEMP